MSDKRRKPRQRVFTQALHHACALRTRQVERPNEHKCAELEGFWQGGEFCECDNREPAIREEPVRYLRVGQGKHGLGR